MHSEFSQVRKTADWPLLFLLVLGASLRIYQYLVKSSFWGDELAVAEDLCSQKLLNLLLHPLPSGQMVPSGFLLFLKLVVASAGASEFTLRFIPLVSSLLALPLFAVLARRFLSREALLLAVGAFVASPPLIRYAAQVKPYSSDVAISLICLLAVRSWMATGSPRNAIWLAAVTAASIWFSYPAMFVLATIGLIALLKLEVRPMTNLTRQAGGVLAACLTSAGALAIVEFHRYSEERHSFMLAYWADWLLPGTANLRNIGSYLLRITRDCFSDFLHLPLWPVFFVLLLIGSAFLVRRTNNATLILAPVLFCLEASILRVYPFSGRLLLFLVPNLLILIAIGVEAATNLFVNLGNFQKARTPLFLGAAFLLCFWPFRRAHPPYYDSETKPMIAYLGRHLQTGDAIYVHDMAWRAFAFYGPEFGLRTEEAWTDAPPAIAIGPKPLILLKDLEKFRGRSRFWILFAGGYPVEETCPVFYLDKIGHRLDHQIAMNASVYLYDLSDSGHPVHLTAQDFFNRLGSSPACSYSTQHSIGPQK